MSMSISTLIYLFQGIFYFFQIDQLNITKFLNNSLFYNKHGNKKNDFMFNTFSINIYYQVQIVKNS